MINAPGGADRKTGFGRMFDGFDMCFTADGNACIEPLQTELRPTPQALTHLEAFCQDIDKCR